DQRPDEVREPPGDDRGDQVHVPGGGEHSGGWHDDFARKRETAALADHEDEHGEEAVAGDEIADGGCHTVSTVAAFTARKGEVCGRVSRTWWKWIGYWKGNGVSETAPQMETRTLC